MRLFVAILVFSFCAACLANDAPRPRVSSAPLGDMRGLIDNIASCCEKGDLEGFLGCFSKSKRSTMRKESKKLFSEHKVRMTVLSVETLLVEDDQTNVRLEYIWDVDMTPAKRITSNAVVKMEDGSWRIHSEKILSSRLKDAGGPNPFDFGVRNDGLPADIGRHNNGECANGQCGVQIRIAPLMIPVQPIAGDGLPLDIGRHQIGQCANGQCGVQRVAPERIEIQPVAGDGLPADIGRHRIGPCANGQCGVRPN